MDEKITIKAQTLKQLANAYQIGTTTMRSWLVRVHIMKQGEKRPGYIFTPAEVKSIYDKLGDPGN